MQGVCDHLQEIPLQRIDDIESRHREQEGRNLIVDDERSSLLEHVVALEGSYTSLRDALESETLEDGDLHDEDTGLSSLDWQHHKLGVDYISSSSSMDRNLVLIWKNRANRNARLIDENQSQNGDDNDNGTGGNGTMVTIIEMEFRMEEWSGTEGVVGLARWFEKMEYVFHGALTWWNSHVQTIGIDEAYEMPWKDLMKLMIEVYYLRMRSRSQRMRWFLKRTTRLRGSSRVCQITLKRKFDNNLWGNHVQQPPFKRQNVAQAVTMGNSEKRGYDGSAPYCKKCRMHDEGPCTIKCTSCKKNRRNKAASNDARGIAYTLGRGDGNPDSNVVTGMFLLNNHYAYILFDSRADRSFVSTTFSALIDIPATTLDVSYTVELADGKIAKFNTIIRDYTLNLLDHPFSTDLMPVELEKIVRITYINEILMIRGDKSNKGSNSRLSIISCTKTQKYIQRGCHVFLAHILVKKTEAKSEEKRLEDVPVV
ncbi:hypothetical protein Tco_1377346 [Tanacetum coccineum]